MRRMEVLQLLRTLIMCRVDSATAGVLVRAAKDIDALPDFDTSLTPNADEREMAVRGDRVRAVRAFRDRLGVTIHVAIRVFREFGLLLKEDPCEQ